MPYISKYIKSNPLHLKSNVETFKSLKQYHFPLKQLVWPQLFFSTLKSLKTFKYVPLEHKWLAYLSSWRFHIHMTKSYHSKL